MNSCYRLVGGPQLLNGRFVMKKPNWMRALRGLAVVLGLATVLISSRAMADQWIPYTDGRVGGCFLNNSGFMFGCTPQPPAPPVPTAHPSRAQPEIRYVPTRDPQQDLQMQQQIRENAHLRQQLNAERRNAQNRENQVVEQQNRAAREAELQRRREERAASVAWLATPEGQAQLAAANAQRAATEERMNSEFQAIKAKPRSKARQNARGIAECSAAGGLYTCSNVGCLCD